MQCAAPSPSALRTLRARACLIEARACAHSIDIVVIGLNGDTMQAAALMIIYVLTAAVMQFIGFLISRLVDYEWPAAGLMTFLVLFLAAYGVAWPVAVWITEWMIRRAGYVVQTEQRGGDKRRDVARPKTAA